MADTKITALAAIATVDPAADVLPIVDISDTSMAATGTTKKVTSNQILGSGGTATLASATITGAATVGTTLGVTGVSTFAAGTAALPALTTTGDTNTGIYYPAADTFAVTTGGTERYRVDSTGLGIGVAPTNKLTTSITRSANVVSAYFGETGTGNINDVNKLTLIVQNTLGGSSGGAGIGAVLEALASNKTGLAIYHDDGAGTQSEAARFNSTGNLVLKGGTVGATGVGVTFPAAQIVSSDANCLDDYEEGTFTPTVIGTTTAGVGVYSTQAGRYTKVGNLVTLQVYLNWTAHTGTGNMLFGNFPFTTSSTQYSAAAIGYASNIALTAGNVLTAFASTSVTSITPYQTPTGGGSALDVPIDSAGQIIFTITYSV